MSFGDELRRERELRQISLREIAEATKVNIRYLEAMERNDFEHLPGGVFNRGFVRAYAQFIGIDPEATVNSYLLEQRSQEAPAAEPAQAAGSVLRGHARPAPRTAPRARTATRSIDGRTWMRWGLLAIAAAILVLVGFLVYDALRSGPVRLPAGRGGASAPDGRGG